MQASLVDGLGYLAAIAVLATFSVRSIGTLRVLAIISNVLFIAYAAFASLSPVLVLHALLLPLNIFRLIEAMPKRSSSKNQTKIEQYGADRN